jgi:mRNA (2'-O-methyladenosine-N6-)-methyltransferase
MEGDSTGEQQLASSIAHGNELLLRGLAPDDPDLRIVEDAEFAKQVEAYRAAIRALKAQADTLADAPGIRPDQDAKTDSLAAARNDAQQELCPGAESVDDLDPSEWQVPPHCIPIHANVTTFDWAKLYGHTQFDVIMMDPPWQLATANPTRGVALGYSQLTDHDIRSLPIPQLQQNGFLFVWVINAKYKFTLDLFRAWGYR